MEYCSLGDLSNFIRKRDQLVSSHPIIGPILAKYPSAPQSHGLNKVIVVNFVKQLASSLQFLRSQNLVHRDIKPQNLLLSPPCQTPQEFQQLGYSGLWELPILKIADFGFARFLPSTSLAETLCGSPLYMAPEILRYEKYNAKADLWSVGAVIYEMSVGKPPFRAANHVELLRKIEKAKDEISFPKSAQVPEDITRLICGLLKAKPTERMGFQEFFNDLIVAERNTSSVLLESSGVDLSAGSESPPSPNEIETHNSETETKTTEAVEAPVDDMDSSPRSLEQSINNAKVKVGSSSPSSKPGSGNATKMKRNDSSTSSSVKDSNVVIEKEYVVVEKRTVEVNALADELAKAGTGIVAISPSSGGPLYGYSRRYSSGGTGSSRSSSNASNHRRPSFTDRKMPISISPTNALTKALGYTSNRLFGALQQQQQQQAQQAQQQQLTIQQHSPTSRAGIQLLNVQSTSPNPYAHTALITNSNTQASTFNAENALTNLNVSSATAAKALKPLPQETILEDGEVIEHLKLLATMAHAVSLFAEVKFSQLIPSPPSSTNPATTLTSTTNKSTGVAYPIEVGVGVGMDEDESLPLTLPPDQVKTISEEGVALYVKTLSLLAKAMSIASEWWHHNAFKSGTSPQLNELVQWIRTRFNESLEKAEFLKLKLGDALVKLEQQQQGQHQQAGEDVPVVAEKLIFDRALEESRNAAVNELKNEDLLGCELSYSTSIWMLEALLNEDGSTTSTTSGGMGVGFDGGDGGSRKLDEDDRKTVQLFITSIGNRLKILRVKIEKQGIRN
ncbi:unnamed protein product [Ambrosiozyma monospora]|uniref:Serine/threonine-protein kinase ATG1 n=1 Tax=Ambrosiozyma monospora TaxID=43982 RepID=A0A9W7DHH3_AMBMO|nr:unnamed protein product [Ambrosiozyma monospora]